MSAQTEIQAAEQAQQPIEQNNTSDQNNKQETETLQDKNWKTFRENREIERKQAEEMAKQAKKSQEEAAALKAALDAVLNKPQQSQQHYQQDDETEESEEQRIEKKVNAAIAKREAEAEKRRHEEELSTYPQRITRDYKDFHQVCSADNLDYLDYHYPEVAQAFSHMPEGYDKWASIYKAVKRFIPNVDSKKDQVKADKNFQKPQSISSPGVTQNKDGAPAFHLDDKRKAENYARMQRIMNKLD